MGIAHTEDCWRISFQAHKDPRYPQVNRQGPHSHQRQPTLATPPLLQEQEVPPPRPPTKADARHPETSDEARERLGQASRICDSSFFRHGARFHMAFLNLGSWCM